MLAMTGDNQIFGMKLRFKTVEPVKKIQKLCGKSALVRRTVMIHNSVLNPKDLQLVEKPNARSEEIGCPPGKSIHNFMKGCQCWMTHPSEFSLGLARRTYISVMLISAKSADMKRIGVSISMNL